MIPSGSENQLANAYASIKVSLTHDQGVNWQHIPPPPLHLPAALHTQVCKDSFNVRHTGM